MLPWPDPSKHIAGCNISPREAKLRLLNLVNPDVLRDVLNKAAFGKEINVIPTGIEFASNMSPDR